MLLIHITSWPGKYCHHHISYRCRNWDTEGLRNFLVSQLSAWTGIWTRVPVPRVHALYPYKYVCTSYQSHLTWTLSTALSTSKCLCTFFSIFVQNCQSSFPSVTPAPVPFPPITNSSFSFFFFYKEQGTSVKLTCFLFLLLSTQTFALVVPRCL